eukprot:scaffold85540_cov33-Tisochrysis_lutea.AAC.2
MGEERLALEVCRERGRAVRPRARGRLALGVWMGCGANGTRDDLTVPRTAGARGMRTSAASELTWERLYFFFSAEKSGWHSWWTLRGAGWCREGSCARACLSLVLISLLGHGRVVLDKAANPSEFTALNATLCPEGLVKPWPKPEAAAKVTNAIEAALRT